MFFTVHGRHDEAYMQVTIELDDAGEYRLQCEGDDGYREERFATYKQALEGLRALYPAVSITLHA